MIKTLLLILPITLTSFFGIQGERSPNLFDNSKLIAEVEKPYMQINPKVLKKIEVMLNKKNTKLNKEVINKVLATLQCANKQNFYHNNILTIMDFSLPSNEKRLWIFDMEKKKLLYNTYVSHGIKSGTLLSRNFSNIINSKATSIGVYNTENEYNGRHGKSLKLAGLDKNFNDNVYKRFIVMHGSWYVNDEFVKKYGRIGRSWGCPTVPLTLVKPIIDTIKENSVMVAYYPGDAWLLKSKFLNCNTLGEQNVETVKTVLNTPKEKENRGTILFADVNKNNKREEHEPILAVSAENYQRIFKSKAPLKRMLRRQIENTEYIALNNSELKNINKKEQKNVHFVIPDVKKVKGHWATEMKIISLGQVKTMNIDTVHFEKKRSVKLKSTKRFIRWLGL